MVKMLNPSIQLISSLILSLIVLLTSSWRVNMAFVALSILTLTIFRKQKIETLIKLFAGLIFIALVYFLSIYLHPNQNVLVSSLENSPIYLGLEMATRMLALGSIGISLCGSIEKNYFIASLIKQLKVPTEIAYSILVATNFLTLIRGEYQDAKLALRMRGISGFSVAYRSLLTMIIRLVRQSEFTATAMEAKNFSKDRIQKISPAIEKIDIYYLVIVTVYNLFLLFLLD